MPQRSQGGDPGSYADDLRELLRRHDEELGALGRRVRSDVVAPSCRRLRMRFVSGMGTFFFAKAGPRSAGRYYHHRDELGDLPASTREALGPVLDLLDQPIGIHRLGHYVDDVEL